MGVCMEQSAENREPAAASTEAPTEAPGQAEGGPAVPGQESCTFTAFLGALKAVGFYPRGNPARERMVEQLAAKLEQCPGCAEGICLRLGTEGVSMGPVTVLSRGQDGWDLVTRLFESGLRSLTFLSGVTCEELQDLLNLLACTVRGELNPTDEDLSVLLWEMDLPSIAYRVIDRGEDALPVSIAESGEHPEEASRAEDPEVWEGIHPLERYLASAGGLEDSDLDQSALLPKEDELSQLRNVAKREDRWLRPKLLMVLAEMLLVKLSTKEFDRVVYLLRAYALDLLQQGCFETFARAVGRMSERQEKLSGDHAEGLTRLLAELSGAEAARRAISAIESNRCDDSKTAILLLSRLAPDGLAVLLEAGIEASSERSPGEKPSIVARGLGRAVALRPDVLLADPTALGEQHLRYLAEILPRPVPAEQVEAWGRKLGPLCASEDAGVRAAALRFLAALRPPDLRPRLEQALNDADSQVRQLAVRLLSETGGSQALRPLLEILLGRGFEKRDFEEQAAVYRALARSSPEEVFPLLEKTVKRRDWLAPGHWRIQKACALRALGAIPIERSGPLLMKYRNSRDEIFAQASREALEEHRRELQEKGAPKRAA